MSLKINEECIACGACEPECPNEAISSGEPIYVIDAAKCTECVGFAAEPKCQTVCPTQAIPIDPAETHDVLLARAKKLHPEKDFSGDVPSHLKK